jgi:hypothetical protein
MMNRQFSWRDIAAKFVKCLQDDRGQAMTEYLLVTGIMVPLAIYLFHPDNGFYQEFRTQYNLTTTLLMYPGP